MVDCRLSRHSQVTIVERSWSFEHWRQWLNILAFGNKIPFRGGLLLSFLLSFLSISISPSTPYALSWLCVAFHGMHRPSAAKACKYMTDKVSILGSDWAARHSYDLERKLMSRVTRHETNGVRLSLIILQKSMYNVLLFSSCRSLSPALPSLLSLYQTQSRFRM